jgi:hypothetical protein
VRCGAVGLASIALLWLTQCARAQYQAPSEKTLISAKSAFQWVKGGVDIVQLQGPVTITLDRATLTAKQAVVWLTPAPNGAPGEEHAEIALLGGTDVRQTDVGEMTGNQRLVTAQVLEGGVQITADQREARDMTDTPLYRQAEELRQKVKAPASLTPTTSRATATSGPSTRAARGAATRPAQLAVPVHLEAGQTDVVDTEEGTVAIVAWDGVKIVAQQSTGETIEMQAQRAVLFTTIKTLRDLQKDQKAAKARQEVTAVYLEGDARIEYLPSKGPLSEQRLMARRIYYELATDRAILLDAVMHTVVSQRQMPFIMRANVLRQLGKGEYDARNVQLTSSAFTVPSYSIAADRLYVRAQPTGDPEFPELINYEATSASLQAFDVPFMYFPFLAGTAGDHPGALRGLGAGQRNDLGFSALTQWGLFETLGKLPPRDLDAAYRVDYFTKRGPALGLDASYGGGFVTDPGHDPWNFLGDLKSWFIYDKGADKDYGRLPVKPEGNGYQLRGRAIFEHQHFFPDDWQAQVRLGYVSDPTFLEEWYQREFYEGLPVDTSAYIKRQRDTEAFTLLVQAQPNRLVTTSDREAEQFEVERFPEVGYHRIGDSFANDSLTFYSDNTATGLEFQSTRATLRQQGFSLPGDNPGIPALGTTGITTAITWREDLRQEIDWPVSAGRFKIVPYLIGRYTEYSDSPGGGAQSRVFGAVGTRMTTSFWKVDPTAESDIFDIHQLRHVIEPEVDVFSAGSTVDRSRLFMYDQSVDAINDTSAVDLILRQRWQTQRGGPGRWRSTDVFTFDVDAQFYSNKPSRKFLQPFDFRGLYFSSLPETSIPRDAVNTNASWRLSDNTIILADTQYNLDEQKLATASVGVLVRREALQSWYIGTRYLHDLNSNITGIEFTYQISPKYSVSFGQSFDFGLGQNVGTSVSVSRIFDRFILAVSASHAEIANTTGFSFNFYPIGLGTGLGSSTVQGPYRR